ncbi:hypothetical protein B0H17DRAFT_1174719 [Mycena rosella]|uniref:Uncharacterized protein n=1 Tax=Mycena rosella TaxID=1033263 RepID=A0AAD7MA70_MYCRO|nr:hypothetical protein B0H17DRAFT_1174719 [Mycena rosella]
MYHARPLLVILRAVRPTSRCHECAYRRISSKGRHVGVHACVGSGSQNSFAFAVLKLLRQLSVGDGEVAGKDVEFLEMAVLADMRGESKVVHRCIADVQDNSQIATGHKELERLIGVIARAPRVRQTRGPPG